MRSAYHRPSCLFVDFPTSCCLAQLAIAEAKHVQCLTQAKRSAKSSCLLQLASTEAVVHTALAPVEQLGTCNMAAGLAMLRLACTVLLPSQAVWL